MPGRPNDRSHTYAYLPRLNGVAQVEAWMRDAACREADTRLFFPERGHEGQERQAQAICGRCVVKDECLEYALVHCIRYGIWGGRTYTQRRRLTRA